MSRWLDAITADPAGLDSIFQAYRYYNAQYEVWRMEIDETRLRGQQITAIESKIAGLTENVHANWAEIKAIVGLIELRVLAATQKSRRYYTESYNRTLGTQQIENYAKADDAVLALTELLLRMKLVCDKWEGISKGLERLHFQIRDIAAMRKAGLDEMVY